VGQFFGESAASPVQAIAHRIGRDAEDLSGLGLAEPVPHQQAKEFLVCRAHPGEGFESWGLDPVDRRCVLRLGTEPEAESEPSARAAMLIGQDSAGGGEQPRQRRLWLRQPADAAPGNSEGLSHGNFGVGLPGRPSEGEREDGAMVLLEGSLEARDIWSGHRPPTSRGRVEFPGAPTAIGLRSRVGCARSG
jgi:hypothetical protein